MIWAMDLPVKVTKINTEKKLVSYVISTWTAPPSMEVQQSWICMLLSCIHKHVNWCSHQLLTIWGMSQLPANYTGITIVPKIITDGAPNTIHTYFHPSTKWISKSNFSRCAYYRNIKVIPQWSRNLMQQKHCEFSETLKNKLQLLDCRIEQQRPVLYIYVVLFAW